MGTMVGDWIDDLVDEGVDEATSRSSVRSITGWITDAVEWLVPGSRTAVSTAPTVTTPPPNPLPGLLLLGGAAFLLYASGAFKANPHRITNRNRRRR